MASLTGSTIATSYEQLLSLPDGGGNTSSLVAVTDGDGGTTFCISLTDASTGKAVLAVDGSHASGTEIQIDNSATDGDAFLSFQLSGTSLFTMGVDDGDSDVFKIGTTAIGTGTMFVLDTIGNVGFGVNPSTTHADFTQLHIGGNSVLTGHTTTGADKHINLTQNAYLNASPAWTYISDDEATLYQQTYGYHDFKAAASGTGAISFTNIMRLDINSRISLSNNDSGTSNTVFGKLAGNALASGGNYNVLVGENSGLAITTGDQNTCIGVGTGYTMTTSGNNILIGHGAGNAISAGQTTTDGTVAIGVSALTALTSGARNLAIGYESCLGAQQATDNVAIGYNALRNSSNSSSHKNVAIGNYALLDIVGGAATQNTAIGHNAGQNILTSDDTVIIGHAAGDAVTAGEKSVIIGSDADASGANVHNEIVIGYDCQGQGTNTVTLGDGNVTAVYMADDSGATVHCASIQFPGSFSNDGDANALDDYEEGTWTPTLTNFTIGNGTTTATYTKIGRQVNLYCMVILGSSSSVDGAWTFYNLPFELPNNDYPITAVFGNYGTNNYPGYGYAISHRVYLRESLSSNAAMDATTPFTWAVNDKIYWHMIYED